MELPQDIRHIPGTWNRRLGDAWTDAAFRAPVLAFMRTFAATHSWALDGWDVTERFTGRGIDVKVPRRSPVQPAEGEDFAQRDGMRILVLGVMRARDRRRFEVALTFPDGAMTSEGRLAVMLDHALVALEAAEREQR